MILTRQNNPISNQKGNAFILILVGIFLFAALAYTFTRSGQKGTGNLTKNQANIAAQEILNYAQLIEGSINRVRQKGCSENEINFGNTLINGYSNTDTPTDGSCSIFNNNGGKAVITNAQENWTNSGNDWGFNAELQVTDVGTTCATANCTDLALTLEDVQTPLCAEINRSVLGDSAIPTDSNYDFTAFTGSFLDSTDIADEAGSAALEGRSTGCFASTADSQNIFYHILLAR